MESASVGVRTAPRRVPETTAHRLRREVGFVGLLFTSVGSIIGSGWLFGALTASQIAGPAALISWVIGGAIMLLIAFSFLVGMIVFLPFPGWQQLVAFVADATVLAYATAPLALGALRRQDPDRERPFRLPGGSITACLAFVVANEVLLFSGWAVVWKLIAEYVGDFTAEAEDVPDRPRRGRRLQHRSSDGGGSA
jgi:amino acid transporter